MKRRTRYYFRVIWMMVLAVLFVQQVAAQQTATVTGVVSDNLGDAVIGASVVVQGTTNGCITDIDGNFSLPNVPLNGILTISYIGYKTLSIPVSGKKHIVAKLEEDAQALEEVVVVGYGVQRKSDLTGAVASVKAGEALKNTPTANISEALQGRMAGVSIVGAGDPTSEQTIRVRGVNSITAETGPLVVIDGFIGGSLKSLNPADIQSIEVLKDASATAVYGSRGANGVILVTTKSPNKGKTVVSVNAFASLKKAMDTPDRLSPYEFAQMANAYGKEYHESQNKPAVTYYNEDQLRAFQNGSAGYDYVKHIFNSPALTQNYELSISGGGEKTTFLASARYAGSEGIIKKSKNDAFNYRLKVDTEIRKWMKVGLNFWGDLSISSGPRMTQYEGLLVTALNFPNTMNPRDENGNYNNLYAISGLPVYNPMGHINEINGDTRKLNNHLQGYVDFKIMDGLTFRSQLGVTFNNYLVTSSSNKQSYYYFKNSMTQASSAANWDYSWLNTNTLNYVKEFNSNHRINATAVLEQSYSNEYMLKGVADDITYDRLGADALEQSNNQSASSERVVNTLLSGLFRVNYVFMNRYMLTASYRADGSSRLKDTWDYFPSLAIAWDIKQEPFMQKLDAFHQLKLRLGYGSVGNQAVRAYRQYSQMVPVKNPDGTVSYVTGRPASRFLKWERNDQFNAGLDMAFLDGRLTFAFDWYNKTSKDVLLEVKQPVHTGWPSLLKNAGEIQNKGFEVTIGADPVTNKNFNWHTDVTLTHNKGIYKKIPTANRMQLQAGEYENTIFRMVEGEKLGSFWGYINEGVWKTNEVNQTVTVTDSKGVSKTDTYANIYGVVPGQEKIKDVNMDGSYNEDDQQIIGNGQPAFNWGWNNTFHYKNFDLSLFIVGFHGFDIYNATDQSGSDNIISSMSRDEITPRPELLNRWTKDNENTNVPGFVYVSKPVRGYNTRFVEKGDFVKVKSITLGYNLPNNLCHNLHINNARVYLSLQNPFLFTSYKGMDPEATLDNPLTTGADWSKYPNGRSYLLGVNFSF